MKNFKLIASDIDTQAILDELDRDPEIWNKSTGRQDKIPVQKESRSIPIRGLVKSKINGRKRRDVHESRFTTTSKEFPVIVDFIKKFAEEHNAEMGRAKVVNLKAGCKVYPHIDRGDYYKKRDRYHLVLRSNDGSFLTCEDEELRMKEGELWWFDNNKAHGAHNDSDGDRIHLIFDMLAK